MGIGEFIFKSNIIFLEFLKVFLKVLISFCGFFFFRLFFWLKKKLNNIWFVGKLNLLWLEVIEFSVVKFIIWGIILIGLFIFLLIVVVEYLLGVYILLNFLVVFVWEVGNFFVF